MLIVAKDGLQAQQVVVRKLLESVDLSRGEASTQQALANSRTHLALEHAVMDTALLRSLDHLDGNLEASIGGPLMRKMQRGTSFLESLCSPRCTVLVAPVPSSCPKT